jgi:hypothetical protein
LRTALLRNDLHGFDVRTMVGEVARNACAVRPHYGNQIVRHLMMI